MTAYHECPAFHGYGKSVHYAYPTSPAAETYGRYNDGCYYVECIDARTGTVQHGPFETVNEAESYLDREFPTHDWTHYYKSYPLPGSSLART